MAGMRQQQMLRDLPAIEQPNPLAAEIDALPENRGIFGTNLFGGRSLDPSNPKDGETIKALTTAIQNGALNESHVSKLMARNPRSSDIFGTAFSMAQKAKQQNNAVSDIYSQSFQPEQTAVPSANMYLNVPGGTMEQEVGGREARPAVNDYTGAIQKLNALGPQGVEYATKLAQQKREIEGKPKSESFNSLDSAYAAIGVTDPRQATQEQHKQALALFQPPVVLTRVGAGGAEEQVVTPRGQALGTTTSTGKNYYKADVQEYAKALEKARIPAIIPSVNKIDEAVTAYDKTGEFPGVGNLKNMRVAQFLKTPEGRFISSAVQNVFNEELRQASGMAVTEYEEGRKKIADALHVASSAEDYIRVYRELIRPRLVNAVTNLRAGYGEAADIYEGRSKLNLRGFTDRDLTQKLETAKGGIKLLRIRDK